MKDFGTDIAQHGKIQHGIPQQRLEQNGYELMCNDVCALLRYRTN